MFTWSLALKALKWLAGGAFDFLNRRVESHERIVIGLGTAGMDATKNADNLNAEVRLKEGPWSPWVLVTIFGFMAPFAWHTWQVVIDSSKWVIRIGDYFLPELVQVRASVATLPGLFEQTEHAVINSLFIGAGAGLGLLMVLKAIKR